MRAAPFLVTLVFVFALAGSRIASACSYVQMTLFQVFNQSAVVAIATPQKQSPSSSKQPLALTRVIKHTGTAPKTLDVHTNAMCDVWFKEGETVLVFVDDKDSIVGLGNGLARKPSATLIDAVERWQRARTPAQQRALLQLLSKSKDPRVAQDAQTTLRVFRP